MQRGRIGQASRRHRVNQIGRAIIQYIWFALGLIQGSINSVIHTANALILFTRNSDVNG